MAYSPATTVTSNGMANLNAIYYEREAIANLKATTPFLSMTE